MNTSGIFDLTKCIIRLNACYQVNCLWVSILLGVLDLNPCLQKRTFVI